MLSASLTGKKRSPHSAETRAKIKASLNKPETRAKLSAINTGKKLSAETRAKIKTYHNKPEVLEKSRETRLHQVFPAKDTELEKKLQGLLKANNIQFTKHKPILGQPDIFIEPNICIFADGDYWHGWLYLQGEDFSNKQRINNAHFEKKIKKDQSIKARLEAQGYKVLRLWEHEVYKEPEKCLWQFLPIFTPLMR